MATTTGQRITDLMKQRDPADGPFIAFEYFPPRTEQGVANLRARFARLKHQQPLYSDVTWGAGGTTSDLTLDLCTALVKEFGTEANMHLTCTNMEASKIDTALAGAKANGIRNIVALRGDAPVGQATWQAVDGGFSCALDLVKHIRSLHQDFFCISVAGYPEGHPTVIKPVDPTRALTASEQARVVDTEAGPAVCYDEDFANELAYLKQKVDAGADLILTQMFFDTEVFRAFVSQCRAIGINCPIIPGIMLLQNYGGFTRMTAFCKTRVPSELKARIEAVKDNEDAVRDLGIALGTEMSRELMAQGVPGLHFYTLNAEVVVLGILEKLGRRQPAPDMPETA